MLPLLTATAFGYWLNQHIGFERSEDSTLSLQVNTRAIIGDLLWVWLTITTACTLTVTAGRSTRELTRTVIRPWLIAWGLPLPMLPTLPAPIQPTR
jgi:hypothetical protein